MIYNVITDTIEDVQTIIVEEDNIVISEEEVINNFSTIEAGPPGSMGETGEKGDKGDPGEPLYITAVADTDIGGHRAIIIYNNTANYASNIDNYTGQIAITTSATAMGEEVTGYVSGTITEPTWNFTKGNVFLSTNGLLTQTIPTIGAVIIVGNSVSPTSLNINFKTLFKRN